MQQGVPIGPLVPLFTFAKTSLHADILVTPLEQYSEKYIGYDPPWELKSENRLLWRGLFVRPCLPHHIAQDTSAR